MAYFVNAVVAGPPAHRAWVCPPAHRAALPACAPRCTARLRTALHWPPALPSCAQRSTMIRALNRWPGGHARRRFVVGSGSAGSKAFFRAGTVYWHGGRTEVMVA
jgi:hypothetical protein